jgi:peptidoglycan/xylan/chitin deacetylase (PgdA/CDA1 family)
MICRRICFIFFSSIAIFLLSLQSPCGASVSAAEGEAANQALMNAARLSLAVSGAYEGAEKDIWWLAAKRIAYRSSFDIERQTALDFLHWFKFRTLRRGDPSRKWVALTFDDGPHVRTTPYLLKILKEHNVKATFFVVGMMAEANPGLVTKEMDGGHLVANHTYHHVNLTKIPREYIGVELKACELVLKHITGQKTMLFRPPGGDYNPFVSEAANSLGYTMVLWTDDPGDYARLDGQLLKSRLLARLSPGGIILLHDGLQETIDILPQLLSTLKAEGYTFVTVDAFLRGNINQ